MSQENIYTRFNQNNQFSNLSNPQVKVQKNELSKSARFEQFLKFQAINGLKIISRQSSDTKFQDYTSSDYSKAKFKKQNLGSNYFKQTINESDVKPLEFTKINGSKSSQDKMNVYQSMQYESLMQSSTSPKNITPIIETYNLSEQNENLKKQVIKQKDIVSKLRVNLQDKVQKLTKFNQLMKIKYDQIKQLKAQIQQNSTSNNDQTLFTSNVKQSNQSLRNTLWKKNQQLDQINSKINNLEFDGYKNQAYQIKIAKLAQEIHEEKRRNITYIIQNSQLNQKIKQLQEKVIILTYENQKSFIFAKVQKQASYIQALFQKVIQNTQNTGSPQKSRNQSKPAHLSAFDQALKVQINQISQLKQVIQSSQQGTLKLNQSLTRSRKQLQQLRNQMSILQLKTNSQRKKLIMQYRLQLHQKDNEIASSIKKFKTLQQKYKSALTDIKAKDQFFRQYLVGRTNEINTKEYIQKILKEYANNFDDIINLKTENKNLSHKLQRFVKYQQLE